MPDLQGPEVVTLRAVFRIECRETTGRIRRLDLSSLDALVVHLLDWLREYSRGLPDGERKLLLDMDEWRRRLAAGCYGPSILLPGAEISVGLAVRRPKDREAAINEGGQALLNAARAVAEMPPIALADCADPGSYRRAAEPMLLRFGLIDPVSSEEATR